MRGGCNPPRKSWRWSALREKRIVIARSEATKQSICRRLAALAESMDHRVASMMLLVMTMRRHECQYLHETAAPLSGLAVSILLLFFKHLSQLRGVSSDTTRQSPPWSARVRPHFDNMMFRTSGRRRLRRPNSHAPVSSIPVTNTKTKTPPKWRGFYFGVPGENRTHSPRFRKPMLYPVELRGQAKVFTAHAPRNKAAGHATRANRAGRRVPNNQPKRECFWRAECRP